MRIGQRRLSGLRGQRVDAVAERPPAGAGRGVAESRAAVGQACDPLVVRNARVPRFVQHEFVHELVNAEAFERRAHAAQVVAAMGESVLHAGTHGMEIAR